MNHTHIDDFFRPLLAAREQAGLYRHRPLLSQPQAPHTQINGKAVINFSSNDYLGLANDPALKQAWRDAAHWGVGSGASHLVSGHHLAHHLLEDELADWLGVERVLLMTSGFAANLALMQVFGGMSQRVILSDKLNHASILDGIALSGAPNKRYRHADAQALEQRLTQVKSEGRQALVVSDGVFSMDGDLMPLDEMQADLNLHQAWLVLDEAHSLGVLGETGRGLFEHFHITPLGDTLRMGTLGKAFGTSGAFIAGSQLAIESLIQFGRTYIYTTAMSPALAQTTREALLKVQKESWRRQHLHDLIHQLRQGLADMPFRLLQSITPIQPLIVGDELTAIKIQQELFAQGIWLAAIRPPTVPQGTARLRITLTASHSAEDVDKLIRALVSVCKTL